MNNSIIYKKEKNKNANIKILFKKKFIFHHY